MQTHRLHATPRRKAAAAKEGSHQQVNEEKATAAAAAAAAAAAEVDAEQAAAAAVVQQATGVAVDEAKTKLGEVLQDDAKQPPRCPAGHKLCKMAALPFNDQCDRCQCCLDKGIVGVWDCAECDWLCCSACAGVSGDQVEECFHDSPCTTSKPVARKKKRGRRR